MSDVALSLAGKDDILTDLLDVIGIDKFILDGIGIDEFIETEKKEDSTKYAWMFCKNLRTLEIDRFEEVSDSTVNFVKRLQENGLLKDLKVLNEETFLNKQ